MTVPTQKHIIFHCLPSWGHNKPIIPFAAKVLHSRPNVIISVLASTATFSKFLVELEKFPAGAQKDAKERLNIIDVTGVLTNPIVPPPAFEPTFKAMYKGESIKCLSTGKEYTLPPPTLAIIDPFGGYAIEAIRETSENKLPILIWATFTAGGALRAFKRPPTGKLETNIIRYGTEREIMPLLPQFIDKVNGEVVTAVGVPPMYDYESHPQDIPVVGHIVVQIARKYIADCNGMIVASSTAYDGKSIEAVKEWFTSLGQVVYPVGPLSLPDSPSGEKGKQVVEFLDKMQGKHGEKSVIYMSFGTFFWPKDPSKVWAVIEEILASGTPLVWAHPSPLCRVPEDKLKMLRESGIAFEIQWAPQEVILSHPATGWFLSHGGWNSIQEAMLYRVPQVFWPQAADQPQNAATVCFNHKAGFELIEVRTGEHGTRLPYRFKDADPKDVPTFTVDAVRKEIRDVLQKLKGDEGLIVRKNFEKMSEEFYGGWEEGGEARQNLNEFLGKFVDGN